MFHELSYTVNAQRQMGKEKERGKINEKKEEKEKMNSLTVLPGLPERLQCFDSDKVLPYE